MDPNKHPMVAAFMMASRKEPVDDVRFALTEYVRLLAAPDYVPPASEIEILEKAQSWVGIIKALYPGELDDEIMTIRQFAGQLA